MSRYVDADALKKRIREEYLPDDDEETEMEQIVDEQPVIDVIEVVRCKDCIVRMCPMNFLGWEKKDDFCSRGKRKERVRE